MSDYRYQLERYRGPSTRYRCPQCGRKGTFSRYIDTLNNNIYISDNVGICNRIDKCGYHYTPKQYYTDNPWKRDNATTNSGSLRPCGYHYTPKQYYTDNPWKREREFSFFSLHREKEKKKIERPTPPPKPKPIDYIPEWVWEYSRSHGTTSDHHKWLASLFGHDEAERIAQLYGMGTTKDGHAIFWQRDIEGHLRTGKIMAYDPTTGHRRKGANSISWVHSELKRAGKLRESWELSQCLYGEHLLAERPTATVALVEAYKTAHVGAILMPDYVWLATDSLSGLGQERLSPLKGRKVLLYPDEGKGYAIWSEKMASIAECLGLRYRVSRFTEGHALSQGDDFVDCVERATESRAIIGAESEARRATESDVSMTPEAEYDWYSFNDDESPF